MTHPAGAQKPEWFRVSFVTVVVFAGTAAVDTHAESVDLFAEVAALVASDGEVYDDFGVSVSLDGNRLAVGAENDDEVEQASGSVYLFERSPGTRPGPNGGAERGWVQVGKLIASDPGFADRFGSSVSLDGDRLAVGAADDDLLAQNSGSVYLFERADDGTWGQIQQLTASDGEAQDAFGGSVSLDGDHLVVSATLNDGWSGAVYLFERSPEGLWLESAKLTAGDRASGDLFGSGLSLDGDRLAIGACCDEEAGNNTGAVYLFERDSAGEWVQIQKILAGDASEYSFFGSNVSLDGARLAVGSTHGGLDFGAAYLFERDPEGTWHQVAQVEAPDALEPQQFGSGIALEGDRLAVGSTEDDARGENTGTVYLFEREPAGSWSATAKLTARSAVDFDRLGIAVALDDGRIAAGAASYQGINATPGSVYLFESVLVSPQLAIAGECPGSSTLTTSGLTPRGWVSTYAAEASGSHILETGRCAGTELDLAQPVRVQHYLADHAGTASWTRIVDDRWCGDSIQILDERTCLTSRVARVPER